MRFFLGTVAGDYTAEQVETLSGLGFKFEIEGHVHSGYNKNGLYYYKDRSTNPTIELTFIWELVELQNKVGAPLIVDGESLTVYDDYIE
jgi:hypothetical protein